QRTRTSKTKMTDRVQLELKTALPEMETLNRESVRQASSRVFRVGEFVLDVSTCELKRNDQIVKVERRPMELLILLVGHRGELVRRDEIVDRIWGHDVFIDVDTSINTLVRKVRRALGDSAHDSRYILTVQGRGYRCIADVEPITQCAVLAVLPFENLEPSREQDYFADGLTEEAIVALGQVDPERLNLIGRTSSMVYRRTNKAITEVGSELGAHYILENSTRTSNGRFRITCRLIRVHDQVQIWTECYDRQSKDLLSLQTELGRTIAEQVHRVFHPS